MVLGEALAREYDQAVDVPRAHQRAHGRQGEDRLAAPAGRLEKRNRRRHQHWQHAHRVNHEQEGDVIERERPDPPVEPEPDESFGGLVEREQQRHRGEQQRARLAHMAQRRHAEGPDHPGGEKAGTGRKAHGVLAAIREGAPRVQGLRRDSQQSVSKRAGEVAVA